MINPNRFKQRVSHDRDESLTFPGSAHEKVTEKWTATTRQNKVGGACDSMVMMASFEMSASVCDQPVLDRMSLLRIRPVIKRSLLIAVTFQFGQQRLNFTAACPGAVKLDLRQDGPENVGTSYGTSTSKVQGNMLSLSRLLASFERNSQKTRVRISSLTCKILSTLPKLT
jgi:hypothetical protein